MLLVEFGHHELAKGKNSLYNEFSTGMSSIDVLALGPYNTTRDWMVFLRLRIHLLLFLCLCRSLWTIASKCSSESRTFDGSARFAIDFGGNGLGCHVKSTPHSNGGDGSCRWQRRQNVHLCHLLGWWSAKGFFGLAVSASIPHGMHRSVVDRTTCQLSALQIRCPTIRFRSRGCGRGVTARSTWTLGLVVDAHDKVLVELS